MFNPSDPYNQDPQNNPYQASNQYNPNNPYSQPDLPDPSSLYPRDNRRRWPGRLGGLLFVLVIVGIFSGLVAILAALQSQPPSIFFQGDFPFGGLGVAVLVGAVVLVLLLGAVMARAIGGRPLGRRARGLFILPLIAAFCAVGLWHAFINPNIGMTRTSFIRSSTVGINDGDTIYFRNPANGVTQILCVGVDQHCQPGDGDPSQLDRGLTIKPGQMVGVVFSSDGEYQITSKTTPHMNITINVTAPSDDGGGDD